ncbi:MAG: hypothetical protein ACREOH_10900 [Candidatus Entotheonellia bacterium]|jgi:hypothetical protein
MFSKEEVESVLNQLKEQWGSNPDSELLLRDVYLGIARADAGTALGKLDPRAIALIEQQRAKAKA